MYAKYPMADGDDYRGFVVTLHGGPSGLQAFTTVFYLDPDMVELTPAEVASIAAAQDSGVWPGVTETATGKIDGLARDIRNSHRDAGDNIDLEYYQVREELLKWRDDSSNPLTVPDEIQVWAEILDTTADAAAAEIESRIITYRALLRQIRRVRLTGKHVVTTGTPVEAHGAYYDTIDALEALRGPII